MLPADIHKLVWVSSPALSPDGAQVAYVVHRIDEKANRYRSRVWLAAVDGSSRPLPVSAGEHNDAAPTWSPDGAQLFFTTTRRTDDKGRTRSAVYALRVGGPGEAALLCEHDEPISGLTVAPDSTKLAYACRVRGEHYASDDIDRRPPRRIDRPFYRVNGLGTIIDRPSHIHVLDLSGDGAPLDVVTDAAEYTAPAWGPDSTWLAVTRTDTAERMLGGDIARIDLASGDTTVITDRVGAYGNPVVGPDGRIVCVGYPDAEVFPCNNHIALLDIDGAPAWLTGDHDRDWCSFPVATAPTWDDDGLLALVADHGSVHLRRVALDGGTSPVVGGDRWVMGWSAAAGVVAFVAEDATRPGELFVVTDGEEHRLTSVTDPFVRAASPQAAERFTAPAPDTDGVEIDAWIVRPPDFDPAKRYPALLNIHGGPFTQYGDFFYDEAQHQARAGFVVIYSNPRGGSGRDQAWGRAIRGRNLGGPGWGTVDYADLMSVVDTALERFSFIDAQRLGVIGGSYGGYMTSWIIGHTNRFAAACSERAVNNLVTLDLTSDIAGVAGFWFDTTALGDHEEMMAMSPITYADQIDTPLLIIHSDEDWRCGFEQADQLYFRLRERDHDVTYYRFPGENHELSRSGSPIHRVQRADLILDFFRDKLGVEAEADT